MQSRTGDAPNSSTSGEIVSSRARFITDLNSRVQALRQGLTRVGASNHDLDELNAVKRRVHALAAAAGVLDFGKAAEALAQAEAALVATGSAPMAPIAIERVTRILDALPTLVLGGSVTLTRELDSELNRPLRPPFSLLLFGGSELANALSEAGPLQDADCRATTEPDELLAVQMALGPDAVLLDGDLCPDGNLIQRVVKASDPVALPIVVVCSFTDPRVPEQMLRAGASRVLPHPTEPWVLQRTLRQACVAQSLPSTQYSSFEGLTPQQLVQAISQEARTALVDALSAEVRIQPLQFHSGAPVLGSLWTALAKIRALATEANPDLRFAPTGPSGSIPITPSTGQRPLNTNGRGDSDAVALGGRHVLVVHPRQSVRRDLEGLLHNLGVSVRGVAGLPEAQLHAHQHWPDAIICGPQEAGFEGLELSHAIEQDIALADVPVLLVTQPLTTPLSQADSIAPFLRDALIHRAQLESRLKAMREVHGRLDGITPRLLLELASRHRPDCSLALRSASLRFDVRLQAGRLAFASLHRDAREVSRGEDVLGPLLGTRTGRYRIVSHPASDSPPPVGTLHQVLAPTIERARRARHCLSAGELQHIARVHLDPSVVSQYLTECPRPVRTILTRLTDGLPPRRLRERTESIADTTRLQTTLEELCRRGAVVAVFDDAAVDKLAEDAHASSDPSTLQRTPLSEPPTTPPLPSAETVVPDSLPQLEVPPSELLLSEAVRRAVAPTPNAQPSTKDTQTPLEAGVPVPGSVQQLSEPPVSPHVNAARNAWREGSDDPEQAALPERSQADSDAHSPPTPWLIPALIVTASATAVAVLLRSWVPQAVEPVALQSLPPPKAVASAIVPTHPPLRQQTAKSAGKASPDEAMPGAGVGFSSEVLPLPQGTTLLPGHGLLEVHSWGRTRISVDGVFMGNYKSRLIPLRPGTYQLQLGGTTHGYSHSVAVLEGSRVRVVAKHKSPL